jgi:hypothetical protein
MNECERVVFWMKEVTKPGSTTGLLQRPPTNEWLFCCFSSLSLSLSPAASGRRQRMDEWMNGCMLLCCRLSVAPLHGQWGQWSTLVARSFWDSCFIFWSRIFWRCISMFRHVIRLFLVVVARRAVIRKSNPGRLTHSLI